MPSTWRPEVIQPPPQVLDLVGPHNKTLWGSRILGDRRDKVSTACRHHYVGARSPHVGAWGREIPHVEEIARRSGPGSPRRGFSSPSRGGSANRTSTVFRTQATFSSAKNRSRAALVGRFIYICGCCEELGNGAPPKRS